MKSLILTIVAAFLLAGCDTVDDMRDILDAQEQMRGMINQELGVVPLVGFNAEKGVLIDVSIAFNADSVADRSVSELMRAARNAVAGSFGEKPRTIYIQLVTQPEPDA